MKSKSHIQQHPNQENKSGKATYASSRGINSSTTQPKTGDVDVPQGVESDYKEELLKSKKKQVKDSLPKTRKQ